MHNETFFSQKGAFTLGCNYWASHAGTKMWERWDENVVREDFKRLAGLGLELIRVFPIWSDFQKIKIHTSYQMHPKQICYNESLLPATEAGYAGVSPEAMEHFRKLADIAEENGLKLLVGLVTGWMSGRIFVPPALEKLNLLTDPLAIKWEVLFVRHFVKSLKNHPSIVAWELGNESNGMAHVNSEAEAWNWTYRISSAIRLEDSSRPVLSGMHSLMPVAHDEMSPAEYWSIQTQGELTDMLTAHPYPFSPSKICARIDAQDTIRIAFQAAVETRMYADFSKRPAMVEEIGTFGPSFCDLGMQKTFLRNSLFNQWAYDCRGMIWWCGYEQSMLDFSPSIWNAIEQELGLFDAEFNEKPVCDSIREFKKIRDSLPCEFLPERKIEAICVLTRDQDREDGLRNAWSSFILAKQAGFDIKYQFIDEPFEKSSLYIVPGIRSMSSVYKHELERLAEKAEEGATVYVSLDGGTFGAFNKYFGSAVVKRQMRNAPAVFTMDGEKFTCDGEFRMELRPEGADVIAVEENGGPVITRFKYGKGEIWLNTLPIESYTAKVPGAFDIDPGYYKIYKKLAAKQISERLIRGNDPMVTFTEHILSDTEVIVIAVNNQPKDTDCKLDIREGWRVFDMYHGKGPKNNTLSLNNNDGAVISLQKIGSPFHLGGPTGNWP